MRKALTPAENILWQQLRNRKLNGLKFKRQHSIGNYIADFYCASLKLVIELDGGVHNLKEQKEKDILRDQNLHELGFKVLRFTNDEALYNIEYILESILSIK